MPKPYIRPVRIPFSPLIRELRLRHRWLWLVSSHEPLYFLHPATEIVHIEGTRRSPSPIRISQPRYVFVWSIHCSLNEVKHLHAPAAVRTGMVKILPDSDGISPAGIRVAQSDVKEKDGQPNAPTFNSRYFLHRVEQRGARLLRLFKRVGEARPMAGKGRWMAAHSLHYPFVLAELEQAFLESSASIAHPSEASRNPPYAASAASVFYNRSGNAYWMANRRGDDATRVFAAGVATAVARYEKEHEPREALLRAHFGQLRWSPMSFLRQLIRQESPFSRREGRSSLEEVRLMLRAPARAETQGQARNVFLASWFPLAAYGRFSRYGLVARNNRKGGPGVGSPPLSVFTYRRLVARSTGGVDGRNALSSRLFGLFGSSGKSISWNTPAVAHGFGAYPGIPSAESYMSLSPVRPLAGQRAGAAGTLAFSEGRSAGAGSVVQGRGNLLPGMRVNLRSGGESFKKSQPISPSGSDYAYKIRMGQETPLSYRIAPDKREVASSGSTHRPATGEPAPPTMTAKASSSAPQTARGIISAKHSVPAASPEGQVPVSSPDTSHAPMDHTGRFAPDSSSSGSSVQPERENVQPMAHGQVIQGKARRPVSLDDGPEAPVSPLWHPVRGLREEAGTRSLQSPYAARLSAVPDVPTSRTLVEGTMAHAYRTITRHVVSHTYHATQGNLLTHTATRFVSKFIKPVILRGATSATFTATRPIQWVRNVLHTDVQPVSRKMPLFPLYDYSKALPETPSPRPATMRVLKMPSPLANVTEEPLVQKVPYGDSNGLVHLPPQIVQRIVAGESTTTQINPAVIRANNPAGIADSLPQSESFVATDADFSADAVAEKVLTQLGKRMGHRQLNRFADLIFERIVRRINLEKDRIGIR